MRNPPFRPVVERRRARAEWLELMFGPRVAPAPTARAHLAHSLRSLRRPRRQQLAQTRVIFRRHVERRHEAGPLQLIELEHAPIRQGVKRGRQAAVEHKLGQGFIVHRGGAEACAWPPVSSAGPRAPIWALLSPCRLLDARARLPLP